MKNHLKRIFTPASWLVVRKKNTYIVKPKPGAHKKEFGLPLNIVLKNVDYAKTSRDVKIILREKEVLVDGKRRQEPRFIIGLMDVLSLPEIKKYYRILLDNKGKLVMREISEAESKIKISKVLGKCLVKKGQMQIRLHDGKNILNEEKIKVGDSLVLELPSNKIKQVLELKKGVHIYLIRGQHVGSQGVLEEINGDKIIYKKEGKMVETAKDYALVIGEKESLMKIKND